MSLKIEAKVATEAGRLIMRDPGKYAGAVKGLYLLSFVSCDLGQAARSSYFFLRHIDDVLDGDRKDVENPFTYVQDIRDHIATGNATDQPIALLAYDALSRLEKKAKAEDDPKKDFLASMDGMLFDYERAQDRRVLTEEALQQYYKTTFFSVLNLMFIGLESKLRAEDVPALSYCQGKVYSIRDLEKDWKGGIINIPQEVLTAASLSSQNSYEEVQAAPQIQEWMTQELLQSKRQLILTQGVITATSEWTTQRLCDGLIDPMLHYIDKNTTT